MRLHNGAGVKLYLALHVPQRRRGTCETPPSASGGPGSEGRGSGGPPAVVNSGANQPSQRCQKSHLRETGAECVSTKTPAKTS